MNKKILAIASVLILMIAGLYAYKSRTASPAASTAPLSTYTQAPGMPRASASGIDAVPEAQAAWAALGSYMNALKIHDIQALEQVTYKLSSACADPKQVATCNARMDHALEIANSFKKEDFKNIWFDDRQMILSTDWHTEESDIAIGEAREAIYFVRDVNGDPKVLYFTQPEEIVYSFIDPKQTKSELTSRLKTRITDSDKDGLSDEVETCTYESADPKTCVKTDPEMPDTDGNGWWDSFEQYLK
jgi:hypothetical protein